MRPTLERLGLSLLGLALPLIFYTSAEDAYRLPQLVMLSLALLCLGASWTASLNAAPPLPLGLAAAYFGLRVISQLGGGMRADWLLEQGLYAALFLWGAAHLGDAGRSGRFKAALLTGAAIASIYALLQSYGLDPLDQGRADLGFGARAQSSLGNPDFWGGYLILALPFSLEFPLLQALLMAALVLSQTRAAWLGFAAGALVLGARGLRKPLWRGLAFGAAAFALFAFPNPLNPGKLRSIQRLASSVDLRQGDAGGRLFMDRAALRIALQHPFFGAGGGHFSEAYLVEQGRMMAQPGNESEPYRFTHDAHNDYLQIAAESGFAALGFFLALLALAFRRAWSGKKRALAAVLASFSVNALLHFPLDIVPSAALVWLCLGWALSGAANSGATSPGHLGRALVCLLAACSAFVFMRQLHASVLLNRGMSLSLAGRNAESDAPLRASCAIRPEDERPWMRLGLNADARGDFAGAESDFMHCQWLPEGLADLSLVKAKSGKLDEAKSICLAALQLNPKSIEALGNLGKIEYLRGDARAAEAIYLRALALKGDWAQGHFNLAAIYINSGRKSEARQHLILALRLDPGNAQATLLLKSLE